MKPSTQFDYRPEAENLHGRAATGATSPVPLRYLKTPAENDAALDEPADKAWSADAVDALDAWARHAAAANGFGDALVVVAQLASPRSSYELYQVARAARARAVGDFVGRVAVAAAAVVHRLATRYARYRQRVAAERDLAHLDDRMLRDLGFDRSELKSVAAELVGDVERTRERIIRMLPSMP